jgi:Pentapeptide repeats (8 copies)
MADKEHLEILRQGVNVWNDWRKKNTGLLKPDLREADLRPVTLEGANLRGADLWGVDLEEAKLGGADLGGVHLWGADLRRADLRKAKLDEADLRLAALEGADLREADLTGADLRGTLLIRTDLQDATLTGSRVYGVSVWDIKVNDGTKQQNLIVTDPDRGEPIITVDNIKVAQFIYLLLNNKEIRDVIDTIGRKGVLLLGRFTEGRIDVLERLQKELRKRNFLPMVFNFDKPEVKDFTETVRLLASLSPLRNRRHHQAEVSAA